MSEKAIDYFISYPKSGRTWVRFMYLTYLELHFGLIEKNVFEIEEKLIHYWQPRWLHLGMAPSEKNFFYSIGNINFNHLAQCSCIWITRNIYDTLVSLYHHACHRSKIKYIGTISDFIRDPQYGALKICCFYAAMFNFISGSKILTISYEDMQKDRRDVLLKLLDFVKLVPNDDFVDQVVDKSSFENMKKLGNSYAYKKTWLAPTDVSNLQSYKIRKGISGAYKEELSDEDIAYIQNVADIILPNNKESLDGISWHQSKNFIERGRQGTISRLVTNIV